jgi:hypothetical protein
LTGESIGNVTDERPCAPHGHHEERREAVAADEPERPVLDQTEIVHEDVVHQTGVALEHEGPRNDGRVDG